MLERLGRSRRRRATEKLLAVFTVSPTCSVCMFRNPTVIESVTLPDIRAPPMIGICAPSWMPMRRLKNSSVCPRFRPLDWFATEKAPAFSRKNGRFSGKKRLNRSRLICCWSTSTCAKSVLHVPSRVSPGVTLYLRSAP